MPKILLVDDDASIPDLLARLLKPAIPATGTVTIAHSAREGLDLMSNASFDVVVSDLNMPEMTGDQFLAEVQKRNCPNVIFSLLPDPNPLFPIPFPDAQTYIDAFLAAGWDFVSTAVVGIHPISPTIPNVAHFPRAASLPINIVARNIRAHFDWH